MRFFIQIWCSTSVVAVFLLSKISFWERSQQAPELRSLKNKNVVHLYHRAMCRMFIASWDTQTGYYSALVHHRWGQGYRAVDLLFTVVIMRLLTPPKTLSAYVGPSCVKAHNHVQGGVVWCGMLTRITKCSHFHFSFQKTHSCTGIIPGGKKRRHVWPRLVQKVAEAKKLYESSWRVKRLQETHTYIEHARYINVVAEFNKRIPGSI